jgi:hypothetical protein
MEVGLDKSDYFFSQSDGANDHVSYYFAPPTKAIFYLANQFWIFFFQLIILTSLVIPIRNHAACGGVFGDGP